MDYRDERGIIVSWLARITITVAVVGLLLYDGAAVSVNFFGLDTAANDIVHDLSGTVDSRNPHLVALRKEADRLARAEKARVADLVVDREAQLLELTLRRPASTLVVGRLGPTKKWARASATATARTD